MIRIIKNIFNRIYIYRIRKNNNITFKNEIWIGKGCSLSTKSGGKIVFGNNFQMSNYTQFISWGGELIIGDNCSINTFSKIISLENIRLGNNVVIASYVSIIDHNHNKDFITDPVKFRNNYIKKPITIGNNVWIGDKVTILKGVTIGDNVIIGANTVANRDIPSHSIAIGIPMRIIIDSV